jgi:hypothetical protein
MKVILIFPMKVLKLRENMLKVMWLVNERDEIWTHIFLPPVTGFSSIIPGTL